MCYLSSELYRSILFTLSSCISAFEIGLNINKLSSCGFNGYKIQMVARQKPSDNNKKRTLRGVKAIKVGQSAILQSIESRRTRAQVLNRKAKHRYRGADGDEKTRRD